MYDLHAIGLGWPGTRGEVMRRDYLVECLDGLGYQTDRESFAHLAYPPTATSRCASDLLGNIPALPVHYTRSAKASGELVFIGRARPQDFLALDEARISVERKIVMARTVAPFAIDSELARRGAAGLIVQTETSDEPAPELAGRRFPPPLRPPWTKACAEFPGVTIRRHHGDALLAAHVDGSGTVTIEHAAAYFEATSENLIAKLPGETNEFVVVAAHYDTQRRAGPGNSDGGLAALLELARLFRGTRPRLGIRFVAVGCGEELMWGSHAYAQRHCDEIQLSCRAMMNWDLPSRAPDSPTACSCSDELRSLCEAAAAAAGRPIEIWHDTSELLLSDDVSFRNVGIPTIWLLESQPTDVYQSMSDVLDTIHLQRICHATEIGAWVVAALVDGVDASLSSKAVQTTPGRSLQ